MMYPSTQAVHERFFDYHAGLKQLFLQTAEARVAASRLQFPAMRLRSNMPTINSARTLLSSAMLCRDFMGFHLAQLESLRIYEKPFMRSP